MDKQVFTRYILIDKQWDKQHSDVLKFISTCLKYTLTMVDLSDDMSFLKTV